MSVYSIIEQLYSFWAWVTGLGVVLTIVPFFLRLVFNKREAKDESEQNNTPSSFLVVLILLGIVLICGSLIIHNAFIRVPPLYGKTVKAAWQELQYAELNGGLSKGRLIDENNYDSVVVSQSIETGIIGCPSISSSGSIRMPRSGKSTCVVYMAFQDPTTGMTTPPTTAKASRSAMVT